MSIIVNVFLLRLHETIYKFVKSTCETINWTLYKGVFYFKVLPVHKRFLILGALLKNFIEMNKKLLFSIIALVIFAGGYGQSALWRSVDSEKLTTLPKSERDVTPTRYKLFQLNYEAMKAQLDLAPSRDSGQFSDVVIAFPTPEGELKNFRIYEASVMHPDLAANYPGNDSYVGQAIDDASKTIRFSVTMFGLHAMTMSAEGAAYIDTYTKNRQNYIVYDRKDVSKTRTFTCHAPEAAEAEFANRATGEMLASDGIFRRYRLAMASTAEYSAFHVAAAGLSPFASTAQKKAAVLAAMVVTMTRVNGVYERDMSLTMELVANNDAVIFIGTDSFSNDNAGQLINQSQTVINSVIGAANYDIGHTVSTGGGGLAQLNSPCTGNKARGITGSPSPVGDPFDIDYVAHEMGHQFGAQHTFNNSCDGNVSGTTSVEPGSGTTIMAYAGICAPNVQGNSDPYFHAVSIAQMSAFVAGTGNCSVNVANNNAAPIVNAGGSVTIPKGTPFILKGSAIDANGDALTYSWEQTNTEQTTQPPLPSSTTGPNFRSQIPSTSPNRFLPSLQNVLAGNLTTGWEVLSNVPRTFNFALTARDNRMPNGGQTGRANKIVTVSNAGPFVVTSHNTDQLVVAPGSTQTVTWDVAGTTGNGVNTANVNILLSTDGGYTWDTVLVANTPNDGSEQITLPNITMPNCRIIVEAVGNVFYAINGKNIAIGNYTYSQQNVCTDYPFTLNAPITESADNSYPGYQFNITDTYTISDFNLRANVTHPNIGQFNLLIMAPWQTELNTALWYNNATCTGANMDKWFDTAGTAVNCATTNDGGSFLPYSVGNINGYNGNNSAGTWRLYFKDVVVDGNSAAATFNSVTFQLCRTELIPTLSTPTVGLEGFALYPNPNNGSFNIKFNSYSSNKIAINVHDIQGRKIFGQEFENTGLFNENLQLNNVQSGVYLVTVQDGATKEVKRIVVN